MREGWEIKKLNEVTLFKSGKTVSKDIERTFGEVLYTKVGDMNLVGNEENINTSSRFVDLKDINQKQIIPIGSIVFPKRGGAIATNKKRKIVKPTIVDLNTMAIAPSKKLLSEYLYFWFESIDLNDLSNGTSIPQINNNSFDNVFIPFPKDIREQKQIVAILDKAFTAIDQAIANISTNIENAKELFQSKLNDIFSQKGSGWEEKSLGEIANVNYGYTDKSTPEGGDFRYIRITDIDNNGELDKTGKVFIKSSPKALDFILKDNDLLMARTGATFAKVLLYRDDEPSIFASYLIKISFTENILNELYWYFTKSGYYWEQAEQLSSGSAQPHFNGAALKKVKFSYPNDINKQKEIIEIVKGFDITKQEIITLYNKKIETLEELKKSILQKAFAGELTGKEVVV